MNPHALADTRSLVLPVCHSSTPAQQSDIIILFSFSQDIFQKNSFSYFSKNLYEKNLQLEREESAERIGKVKLMGRIDNSNLTKERGVSRL